MLSLHRLERKQKNIQIHFEFAYFSFFRYSFGIETINTFIHSVDPPKTIPDSRPKWEKCIPVFRPKTSQKPYPMGRHIPIWLIEESTPPSRGNMWYFQRNCFIFKVKILKEVRFSESLLILLEIRFVWNNGGQKHSPRPVSNVVLLPC